MFGIALLVSGTAAPSYTQSGSAIRIPFHEIGKAINKGFLYLDKGHYFSSKDNSGEPADGFRLCSVRLGDGTGLSLGAEYSKTLTRDIRGSACAAISTRLYQRYSFELSKKFHGVQTGPQVWLAFRPQDDFFGEGPDSVETNHSNYSLKHRKLGWITTGKVGPVKLRHALEWQQFTLHEGKDRRYAITQRTFSPSDVSGGFEGSRFVTNELGATLDLRDNPRNPKSGAAIDVSVERSNGLGDTTADMTTVHAVSTAYVPLSPQAYHLLAFRAEAVHNAGSDPVPFYLEPTLGGSGTLRGFREYRFRDRDALALTAEYRYRIWRYMDAVVFADAGQVYHNILDDIGDHKLHAAGGIGIRVNSSKGPMARLNVGQSREGTRVFFQLGSTW